MNKVEIDGDAEARAAYEKAVALPRSASRLRRLPDLLWPLQQALVVAPDPGSCLVRCAGWGVPPFPVVNAEPLAIPALEYGPAAARTGGVWMRHTCILQHRTLRYRPGPRGAWGGSKRGAQQSYGEATAQ